MYTTKELINLSKIRINNINNLIKNTDLDEETLFTMNKVIETEKEYINKIK